MKKLSLLFGLLALLCAVIFSLAWIFEWVETSELQDVGIKVALALVVLYVASLLVSSFSSLTAPKN